MVPDSGANVLLLRTAIRVLGNPRFRSVTNRQALRLTPSHSKANSPQGKEIGKLVRNAAYVTASGACDVLQTPWLKPPKRWHSSRPHPHPSGSRGSFRRAR